MSALERLRLDIDYLEAAGPSSTDSGSYLPWSSQDAENEQQAQAERCWNGLRAMARLQRLKPRDCLELVSEELWPAHLLVYKSAWTSADAERGFELGEQLFELLWLLAAIFREPKLKGPPDRIAGKVVAGRYVPRESETIDNNPMARRPRTFLQEDQELVMWQLLKIGVRDSISRTLRLHFH